MPTMTLNEVAEIASDAFETAKRSEDSEDTFTRLKEDAPEWVRELVYEAHGNFLPDDWRYDCIRAAVDWISEDNGDDAGEFADSQVDVYNADRCLWLASNLYRGGYCDEAISEFGVERNTGVFDIIGMGQYFEAQEVFGSVLASLEAQADA